MTQSLNRHDPQTIRGPHFHTHLPKVELEITRGRAKHKLRRVEDATYLFGSGSECDLVLGDPQFPEVHGYILVTPEGVSIRHLGADPVLTVESQPVTSAALAHNDRIRTGPYEFRIHVRWAKAAGALHMPREVVSSIPGKRIDAATEQVGSLLNDIENELSVDQRNLRLFVGSAESQRRVASVGESTVRTAPGWRHLSRAAAGDVLS